MASNLYSAVVKRLEARGFRFLRAGKGSHEVWGTRELRVSVPRKIVSRHTANGILKDAGIREKL